MIYLYSKKMPNTSISNFITMKKILTALLLPFFALTVYAQDNYLKGYVLTLENDTIQGWINFRSDKLNSTVCTFKSDLNSDKQEYYPKDIYGYRFLNDGKFYISKQIEIAGVKKDVFLEFLLEGIENLYYYEEGDVKYYILENMKGDYLYAYQEPEKLVSTEKTTGYKTDFRYMGILKLHYKDYQKIVNMVDLTEYTHESMIKLVKAYHDLVCTPDQSCIIFESKFIRAKYKLKFSAYAGYNNLSSYQLYSTSTGGLEYNAKMDKTYPVIGVQTSLNFPRPAQSFSLNLDISLSSIKGDIKASSYGYRLNTNTINSLVGFMKLGVSYTYYKGIIRPTISIGPAFVNIFDSNIEYIDYNTSSTKVLDGKISHAGLGGYLSAGVDIKVFKDSFIFVKATYEKYFTDLTKSQLTYFGGRIGYTF